MSDVPAPIDAPSDLRWSRALVVDDDAFSRKVATHALRRARVGAVEQSESGAAALARLGRGDPVIDLVLCDLRMPSMDGIEFLRRLADQRYAGAVLLVSGVGATVLQVTEELARARRLHVIGVLEKPVPLEALTRLLETHRPVPPTPARAGAHEQPPTASALLQALEAGEVFPVYQPKIEVATGRLCGVEALARWRRPDGRSVPPDVFIPLAEREGLVDRLTDLLLRRVLPRLRDWQTRRVVDQMAVNVAMSSLRSLDFPDRVLARLADAGVEPTALTLEITESQLMDDAIACADSLLRLRLRGVGLAIDDFGTRYASLSQLRALPFTELKVDRSFVHGAASDVRARAILESSIALGRALGMTVVAEGVEDEDDWQRIVALGCPVAQGYHIARPLDEAQFEAWSRMHVVRRGTAAV